MCRSITSEIVIECISFGDKKACMIQDFRLESCDLNLILDAHEKWLLHGTTWATVDPLVLQSFDDVMKSGKQRKRTHSRRVDRGNP